jgi:threonine dehydrogenase-like Zn-dependent dehydrogenase
MEKMYGHRLAGIFGYSHLTGGYDGGQADFARVPYADVNCLKITSPIPDEKALFLSDILCTGWHACVQGEVSTGKTVAIWGSGPVGLAAMMWAKFLGAKRIIAIDSVPYRLNVASYRFGAETINFEEKDVYQTMRELVPGGPDVCIDAVGFRFPKTLLHKIERTLHLETDAPQVLTEAIMCCRKAGNLVIIGDYFAYANHFPIGALMEKSLVTRGGQVYVQKYWKELLGYIESGKVDPTFFVTHHMSLDDAPRAYKIFDQKEENALKIILKPSSVEPK